jgi:hypothetical protein
MFINGCLFENPFLRDVDLNKYKLHESVCHPELNDIRYPK